MRYWIADYVGVAAFKDVGGMSSRECERLIGVCKRAFAGNIKLPRGARIDKKLKLQGLMKLRAMLQNIDNY